MAIDTVAAGSFGTQDSEPSNRSVGRFAARVSGYDVVRCVLGLLLLAAAVLKSNQLATEPVAGTSLLTSRWFLIAIVELELALGLALLLGLFPRVTRRVAISFFTILATASLFEALGGATSCGCFGRVPMSPWLTLVIDVVAVTVLLRFPPRESVTASTRTAGSSGRSHPWRASAACFSFLVLGVPAGWAMATFTSNEFADDGSLLGDGSIVVLEPEKWVGRPFPLLRYIDVGQELARGQWIVVLYHHDCPKCQALIAEYGSSPDATLDAVEMRRIALIELPPFDPTDRGGPFSLDPGLVRGKLSRDQDWFVSAPVEIELRHGVVSRVSDGGNHGAVTAWRAK